jgi:hypothetical protein
MHCFVPREGYVSVVSYRGGIRFSAQMFCQYQQSVAMGTPCPDRCDGEIIPNENKWKRLLLSIDSFSCSSVFFRIA